MGSFGGVKFDAQNFQETVDLAQQKALAEQNKLNALQQGTNGYVVNLPKSTFPDGEYYVTSNFNSQQVRFQGDIYNPFQTSQNLKTREFKKGELVNVITFIKDMAMNTVKVIETDSGNFYADQNKLSKTKPVEPITAQSLSETREKNENKTKLMIIGAFVLGFILSRD